MAKHRRSYRGLGGRETKCTPELIEQFCSHLRIQRDSGAPLFMVTVAALCGIHVETVHDWLRRGETERLRLQDGGPNTKVKLDEECYLKFSEAVNVELASTEEKIVRVVLSKNPTFILQRRFPKRWAGTGLDANGAEQNAGNQISDTDTHQEVDTFGKDSDAGLAQLLAEQLNL